jgi:hypothetical protein
MSVCEMTLASIVLCAGTSIISDDESQEMRKESQKFIYSKQGAIGFGKSIYILSTLRLLERALPMRRPGMWYDVVGKLRGEL